LRQPLFPLLAFPLALPLLFPPPLPVGGAGDFSTGGGEAYGPLLAVWLASAGLVVSPLGSAGAVVSSVDPVDEGDGLVSGDVLTSVVSVLLSLGAVLPSLLQPAASPTVATRQAGRSRP
jgi:hypothetical protein